jgi:hypothetical protein
MGVALCSRVFLFVGHLVVPSYSLVIDVFDSVVCSYIVVRDRHFALRDAVELVLNS